MSNSCPDGYVMDRTTKECRPPLKRGRKSSSSTTVKSKKPCPDGQVLDKKTKKCRLPLKRGRTAKKSPSKSLQKSPSKSLQKSPSKSPSKSPKNTTLDKYGFSIPVFKPKVYEDEKTYKQTTMLAFSKKAPNV